MARSMRRIAAILLVFILLTEGPHVSRRVPIPHMSITIEARPLRLPTNRALQDYGPLRLLGLWQLSSDNPAFSDLSALLVKGDGRFLGLSDRGNYVDFAIGQHRTSDAIAALPRLPAGQSPANRFWDSESMARDPRTGRIWVGLESMQSICRYAPAFARLEGCVSPAAMQDWPRRASIESLVRFSDGRFLAIEEEDTRGIDVHDVLLWAGDPVERGTPPPDRLSYVAPPGYWPTDALWLGGDRLLVLNRRMTIAEGLTAKLVMVRLPRRLRAGTILRGTVVATFRSPGPVDNLEALALGRNADGPVLWIASDNNHKFFERTLLFQFALPNSWVSNAPAPR